MLDPVQAEQVERSEETNDLLSSFFARVEAGAGVRESGVDRSAIGGLGAPDAAAAA